MLTKIDLKLDWATFESAKYACTNWHYSKCIPVGKLVKIGVWENNNFIGVVLFSRGANNKLASPYGLDQTECCELTRIALTNHKTSVSRILSIAIKFLKKNSPGLKLIISFADTEQNHHGGIYQASNWIYAGMTKAADEYLVHGKRMHGRSMRMKYTTHIGKEFIKIIKGSSKHRYLLALDKNILNQISILKKPYPKRTTSKEIVASGFQSEEGSENLTVVLHKEEQSLWAKDNFKKGSKHQ